MAKWWDERANLHRKWKEERASYPAPARRQAPAPPVTASEWMREYEVIERPFERTWVNTGVITDWKVDLTSMTSTTNNWLRDDYDAYVDHLRYEIARPSIFKQPAPTMDKAREVGETNWVAPAETHPRIVLGRVNPRDPSRVQYMHMTGRLSHVDTTRTLSRYWATPERVDQLFDSGTIDILHPDVTQSRWGLAALQNIETRGWESGTKNRNILQWADGRWYKRDSDYQLWVAIDPEKLE